MDSILYWNEVALEANKRDFSDVPGTKDPSPEQGGPTLSSRALAIVHLAMYDAHAGVVQKPGLPRYLASPLNPAAGGNAAAAVAAAATACLSALYPRQKMHFDAALAAATGLSGPGTPEGRAFGLAVAQAMMADRGGDPGAGAAGYVPSAAPMHHRVDPVDPKPGFHAPYYGAGSKCFGVTARHGLDVPPQLGSAAYATALKQVRGKGVSPELMGTVPASYAKRTVDETLAAVYWAYDGVRELGTPPRFYNQIARKIAMEHNNDVDKNARLFAFLNVAMGDAGILAWDQKYIHDVWRPVLGVREHDASMGPAAPTPAQTISDECDPNWLPMGAPHSNSREANTTPQFPAYPSGHATFGAAAFHIIRLFYGVAAGNRGNDTVFTGPMVSDELNGTNRDNKGVVRPRHARKFPNGLWQMIIENGFSRVWLGVHWSFDAFGVDAQNVPDLTQNIGGVPLGLKIAEDIFAAGAKKAPKKSTVGPRP